MAQRLLTIFPALGVESTPGGIPVPPSPRGQLRKGRTYSTSDSMYCRAKKTTCECWRDLTNPSGGLYCRRCCSKESKVKKLSWTIALGAVVRSRSWASRRETESICANFFAISPPINTCTALLHWTWAIYTAHGRHKHFYFCHTPATGAGAAFENFTLPATVTPGPRPGLV